jgi:hypothetical protein
VPIVFTAAGMSFTATGDGARNDFAEQGKIVRL